MYIHSINVKLETGVLIRSAGQMSDETHESSLFYLIESHLSLTSRPTI